MPGFFRWQPLGYSRIGEANPLAARRGTCAPVIDYAAHAGAVTGAHPTSRHTNALGIPGQMTNIRPRRRAPRLSDTIAARGSYVSITDRTVSTGRRKARTDHTADGDGSLRAAALATSLTGNSTPIAKRSDALLSASAMLLRLNDETRCHHVDADAPWLSLTRVDVRRQDYIRQLALTYGFEAPLEGVFAYTRGLTAVVSLRARAGLIAQDLLALGMTPAQLSDLPQCFSITPFTDVAEAMGWMYVVERATLVHDSVRRSLLQRVPEARHASAYLSAAGSIAATRWQSFGIALDRFVSDENRAQQVARAADHAFRRWRDWIEVNQPEQRSTG